MHKVIIGRHLQNDGISQVAALMRVIDQCAELELLQSCGIMKTSQLGKERHELSTSRAHYRDSGENNCSIIFSH